MTKKRTILWVNVALILPGAISLYAGLRNALRPGHSQDFQWSGTSLALHHVDPYRQFLAHDPGHLILMSQVPNYLHELYLLLLPLGAMSFASARMIWLVCNCIFTAVVLFLLRRIYALDQARTLLLALLFLASTPFRIVVGAGTESLLELFLFCLFFYFEADINRGIVLGLSYLKYSFSPVLFLYLVFQRRYRLLGVSVVPPLLGLLGMWLLVHGSLMTLAMEPFAVSKVGVTPGMGDLMLLVHIGFGRLLPKTITDQLAYAAALLASACCAFFLSRQKGICRGREAALIAVASLMFFTHLTYDFVFLIVPAAACLEGSMNRSKALALSAISLILYGVKVIPMLGSSSIVTALQAGIVFTLLFGVFVLFSRREFAIVQADQSGNVAKATA